MSRAPVIPHARICEVHRQRLLPQDGGGTLFFVIHGLARRARFADPGEVPDFEGEKAFFEVEPKRGAKLGFVFLRQVAQPSHRLTWC